MDLFLILTICILGPIVGAAIGVIRKPSDRLVFHLLSFAAGVMISIALFELLPLSIQYSGIIGCVVGVFFGSIIMFILDKILPTNHLDISTDKKICDIKKTSNALFIAILLHHLPEGLTIAIGSMIDFNLTLVIAIGLGIHYIPESICIAAPYYYCTKDRLKSFLVASITFVPIIVGFFIGYLFYPLIPSSLFGIIIGLTAGIMAHISAVELIPSSSKRVTNHDTILSFIFGIMFLLHKHRL
jgi:ZIP family zinc transporter